jgi:hypothetical protein
MHIKRLKKIGSKATGRLQPFSLPVDIFLVTMHNRFKCDVSSSRCLPDRPRASTAAVPSGIPRLSDVCR